MIHFTLANRAILPKRRQTRRFAGPFNASILTPLADASVPTAKPERRTRRTPASAAVFSPIPFSRRFRGSAVPRFRRQRFAAPRFFFHQSRNVPGDFGTSRPRVQRPKSQGRTGKYGVRRAPKRIQNIIVLYRSGDFMKNAYAFQVNASSGDAAVDFGRASIASARKRTS